MSSSVVIVSYRPDKWLAKAITSVIDQADHVIVVDNGSEGAEASAVASRLGARVVRLARNVGFAAGANEGFTAARGEYVAVLNDDAVAEPGWLERSIAVLEADATVGAVAPKLLLVDRYAEITLDEESVVVPGDGRRLGRQVRSVTVGAVEVLEGLLGPGVHQNESDAIGPFRWFAGDDQAVYVPVPNRLGQAEVRVDGEPVRVIDVVDLVNNAGSYLSTRGFGGDVGFETPDRGAFDQPVERFAVTGAAMVTRISTIRGLGGFHPGFFAYYEDIDWSWRLRLAGLQVRYQPDAVVRHVRGATSGGPDDPHVRYLAARNRIHMLWRNAPMAVATGQLRDRVDGPWPKGVARSLALRLPRSMGERRVLRRWWTLTPEQVWAEWAGTDDTWDPAGRVPTIDETAAP